MRPLRPPRKHLTSIVVAHPARLVCELLEVGLRRSARRLRVIAAVRDPAELLPFMEGGVPDVILLSAHFVSGRLAGFKMLRDLLAKRPSARVVMLLDQADRELVFLALRAGARGVFSTAEGSIEELATCIENVRNDRLCVSSREFPYALEALSLAVPEHRHAKAETVALTDREEAVIRLIAQNKDDRKIADRLGATRSAVKDCIKRLLEKLGLASRFELTLYAVAQQSGPRRPSNSPHAA